VGTHAAQLAQARYVADGLRYLSGELHRLLEVVVLTAQGSCLVPFGKGNWKQR